MNHEELLAKINTYSDADWFEMRKALCAVVELPKETSWDGGWEDEDAFQSGYRHAMNKVIQAIEKELK